MRPAVSGLLGSFILLALATSASATPATHAPEIDGAAGLSAIAVLISAGLIAYNKLRS